MKTKIKVSVLIGLCLQSEIKLLDLCLSQCLRHSNPDYEVIYFIADQTDHKEIVKNVVSKYPELNTVVIPTPRIDAGYFIDYLLTTAEVSFKQIWHTDYTVNLDVDAFPISHNWLNSPISYMEANYRCLQVGVDTNLTDSYPFLPRFTHLNNYFRIQRTIDAFRWSRTYGFRRPTHGKYFVDCGVEVSLGIMKECSDFQSKENYYKYNYGITRAIGETPQYGLYGFVLDEKVLHICFGSTAEVDFPDLQKRFEMLGKHYLNMVNVLQYWGDTRDELNRIADHLNNSAIQNIWRPQFKTSGIIGL